jgi:hypothetical protein
VKTLRTASLPPFYTHGIDSLPRPQAVRDLLARRDELPPCGSWAGCRCCTEPTLLEIGRRIEAARGRDHHGLLSRYRSGSDSVGLHADDEPGMGDERPKWVGRPPAP